MIRKQRELEDAKRELELTVEKRVQSSVDAIRCKARQDADEAARLRISEKDQTIDSMARTIEELKCKAEQGSQQIQGEVSELELEEVLRARFPTRRTAVLIHRASRPKLGESDRLPEPSDEPAGSDGA